MYRLYSIACNKHPYRRFPRKIASAPSSQAYINLDSSSGRFTWWTSPTTILEPKIYRAILVATLNCTGILILNKIHFYTSSIVPLRIKCKKKVSFSYLLFHARRISESEIQTLKLIVRFFHLGLYLQILVFLTSKVTKYSKVFNSTKGD